MIKARYSPATEDLVEQLMASPVLPGGVGDVAAAAIIDSLKDLGYDISIEVEVHGDMAKALESLGGDTSNYVTRERPKRHA